MNEEQELFAGEFVDSHELNPSMNTRGYYFQVGFADGEYFFTITPKQYYDMTGAIYDQGDAVPLNILPNDFSESAESEYYYDGNHQAGRNLLLTSGFIEKKMF